MNQNDDYTRAIQEAIRGVVAYAQTGECPRLSICGERSGVEEGGYGRDVEEVAEMLLDWKVLDGDEVQRIIEASRRSV